MGGMVPVSPYRFLSWRFVSKGPELLTLGTTVDV